MKPFAAVDEMCGVGTEYSCSYMITISAVGRQRLAASPLPGCTPKGWCVCVMCMRGLLKAVFTNVEPPVLASHKREQEGRAQNTREAVQIKPVNKSIESPSLDTEVQFHFRTLCITSTLT